MCFITDLRTESDFALYTIKCLVFVSVVKSVYCAALADSLHKADTLSL